MLKKENSYFSYDKGIGINGELIRKSKREYPYSYDAFLQWGNITDKVNGSAYSDRLRQWDYEKHNEVLMDVFGDKGHYWENRNPEKIEKFLQLYFDKPELKLVRIFEGCNVSNGFPYWYFEYLT